MFLSFFFFNDTATTEIYTLSLHDALPICRRQDALEAFARLGQLRRQQRLAPMHLDRKSTRLNSSHLGISYAVFCLKKKKAIIRNPKMAAAYCIDLTQIHSLTISFS